LRSADSFRAAFAFSLWLEYIWFGHTGGGIMIRVNGAAFRPSACALLFLCATAPAQQPGGVSIEADSMSFDGQGNSVFKGLTVTDGTFTISAEEGTTTSQNGGSGLWELRAGLRIAIDAATLAADSGTMRAAGGRFTEIEFLGAPVTLEGTAGGDSRQFRLTAGRIAYDGTRGVLQASEGVVFVSDGLEVRNCNWTYDLSDKSVQAVAETASKCAATVALKRETP
jgi:lipopolysaccharide export system protein LptA